MLPSLLYNLQNEQIKVKVEELFQQGESKWNKELTFSEKKEGLNFILYSLKIMKTILIKKETNEQIVEKLQKQFKTRYEQAVQKLDYLEKLHKSIKHLEKNEEKQYLVDQQKNLISNDQLGRIPPELNFNDIFGIEKAKNVLEEAVLLPMKFPQFFERARISWKGILIFGPPGTGKTFFVQTYVAKSQINFLSISYNQMISQLQGETDLKIKQCFSLAKEKKFAIIFIDDCHKMCQFEDNQNKEISRQAINEYLMQMQRIKFDKAGGILVIGATNQPWVLETQVRRTFEKRIYISLPDVQAREQMIQNLLRNTQTTLTTEQFKDLAQLTEGYSGSDISTLVKDVVHVSAKRLESAQKLRQAFADEQQEQGTQMKYMHITQNDTLISDICYNDFQIVLENFQKSVSQELLEKFKDWAKEFGDGK